MLNKLLLQYVAHSRYLSLSFPFTYISTILNVRNNSVCYLNRPLFIFSEKQRKANHLVIFLLTFLSDYPN